jgi:DNA-binding LacI/PurR family transcriptional regulator
VKRMSNKQISDLLGISVTSVSLALNNRPGVSEATRQKVIELKSKSINDIKLANNLPHNDKKIVFVVHKKNAKIITEKAFFAHMIETAQMETMKSGYQMVLCYYSEDQDLNSHLSNLNDLKPDGILLVATELDREDLKGYKELGIPIVLLDSDFELDNIDTVSLDNSSAIIRLFEYAVQHGHKNIGYLKSEVNINNFSQRLDGFYTAINRFHLEDYNHPVIKLPVDIIGAQTSSKNFFDHPDINFSMPTCFLSDLDYIAIGAIRALKEIGYRVPEDVSVIGFDNVLESEISEPPLTTMSVNQFDLGRIAGSRLIQKISEKDQCILRIYISSVLIERKSVKLLNSDFKK